MLYSGRGDIFSSIYGPLAVSYSKFDPLVYFNLKPLLGACQVELAMQNIYLFS